MSADEFSDTEFDEWRELMVERAMSRWSREDKAYVVFIIVVGIAVVAFSWTH